MSIEYIIAQYQIAAKEAAKEYPSKPSTIKLIATGDELLDEFKKMERERNDLRDALKGISRNIDNMLKPIGGE